MTNSTCNAIFSCTEESLFYQKCLEELALTNAQKFKSIVEFGSGDGMPVINAITNACFDGIVYGYEYNPKAYEVLVKNITKAALQEKYRAKHQSFFDADLSEAALLIANPPYIPYPSNDILLPHVWGGETGCGVSREILRCEVQSVMLLISSYSNPIELIDYARSLGYSVTDFLVTHMSYGIYSSEPKVKAYIEKLSAQKRAFFHKDYYKVAGVLFQKNSVTLDKKEALVARLTYYTKDVKFALCKYNKKPCG